MKGFHVVACLVAALSIGYADAQAKADGGYRRGEPRPCDDDWAYISATGVRTEATTGCLSIIDFPPFRDGTTLADPQDPRTNTNLWCSFKKNKILNSPNPPANVNANYNLQNDRNVDRLTSWGFCLLEGDEPVPSIAPTASSEQETESPTVADSTPTENPTIPDDTDPPATDAPASNPPATFPPGNEPTNMPTVTVTQTEAPATFSPTSDDGEPNVVAPSSLSSGEIAAAVIVPFVVVIAAGGLFAYYKYDNINKTGGQTSPPQGTPMKTEGKPLSDPEEGKAGQEILHN